MTPRPIKRVLVATDFSSNANAAVEEAIVVARKREAELFVLHVMEPIMNPPYFGFESEVEDAVDAARAHLQESLDEISPELRGELKMTPILLPGKATQIIPEVCEEKSIDLAIVGSHGHSSLERMLFLGSTADKLMHKIRCSILIVKTPSRIISA